MTKDWAIIIDETNTKRAVASRWLSYDQKTLHWPPLTDAYEIAKAASDLRPVGADWKTFPVLKFIRYKDDYNAAIADIKANLDEITDASDDEKLKHTRHIRRKKGTGIFESNSSPKEQNKRELENNGMNDAPSSKKSKSDDTDPSEEESSSDEEEHESTKTNMEKSVLKVPDVPSKLNILSASTTKAKDQDVSRGDGGQSPQQAKNKDSPRIVEDINNWNPGSPEQAQFMIFSLLKKVLDGVNQLLVAVNGLKRNQVVNVQPGSSASPIIAIANDVGKHFPINNEKDPNDEKKWGPKSIHVVETKLAKTEFFNKVVTYFSNKGGSNSHDNIYAIMTSALTNKVSDEYSYYGQKKKGKFIDLRLHTCCFLAAKSFKPSPSDDAVKGSMALWLNGSGTRVKREREEKKSSKVFKPIMPVDDAEDDADEHAADEN